MSAEISTWKTFLNGRILQEQGKNEEALKAFESAIAADPSNPSFLNAKANALAALGRSDEAVVARVSRQYGELAKKYVGPNDKPEPWIAGLKNVLGDIQSVERGDSFEAVAAVFW